MIDRATPQYIAGVCVEILRQRAIKEEKDKDFNYLQGSPWRHNRYTALVLDGLIEDINVAVNAIIQDESQ